MRKLIIILTAVSLSTLMLPAAGGAESAGRAVANITSQPLTGHRTSSNWSGYLLRDVKPRVENIDGAWIVPPITCTSSPTSSAVWAGLGGAGAPHPNDVLFQTGTEQNCVNGHPQYFAWWEYVPGKPTEQLIGHPVYVGDHMRSEVAAGGGGDQSMDLFDFGQSTPRLGDQPKWSFETSVDVQTSPLAYTAECIVERPQMTNGKLTSLANFNTVHFSGDATDVDACDATIDAGDYPIATTLPLGPGVTATQLDMTNNNKVLATTTAPARSGRFTALWRASR